MNILNVRWSKMYLDCRMGKLKRRTKKRRVVRKRHNGGVVFMGAPVNYSSLPNQRQPTEAIMAWATTADNKNMMGGSRNFDKEYEEVRNMWFDIYNKVSDDIVGRNGVPLGGKIAETIKWLEEIYNNDLDIGRLKREGGSAVVNILSYNVDYDIRNKIREANKKTIEFIELLKRYNPANNAAAAHNVVAPFFPPNAANPPPPLRRQGGGNKRTRRNMRK